MTTSNAVKNNVIEFEHSVRQTNAFFEKEKRTYANWKLAMIRELFQNSIDAESKNIHFELNVDENDSNVCIVTFNDDGVGMSEDVLVNKLFSLGGTTKESVEGSVGGFGAAKIILFFAHLNYEIRTLDNLIQGFGGDYNIHKLPEDEFVQGTHIKVAITCSEFEDNYGLEYGSDQIIYEMKNEYYRFINNSIINGVNVTTNFEEGSFYSSAPKIYNNKKTVKYDNIEVIFDLVDGKGGHSSFSRCDVLVNGIYMFTKDVYSGSPYAERISYNIKGDSTKILTTNRDGFTNTNEKIFNDVFSAFFYGLKEAEDVLDMDNHLVVDYSKYKGTDKNIKKERLESQKRHIEENGGEDGEFATEICYFSGTSNINAVRDEEFKANFKSATLESIGDELDMVKNKLEVVEEDRIEIAENIALANVAEWDTSVYNIEHINSLGAFIKAKILEKLEAMPNNNRINICKNIDDEKDYVFKVGFDRYNHIGFDFDKSEDAEEFYLIERDDKRILYFNIAYVNNTSPDMLNDVIDLFLIQRVSFADSASMFSEIAKRFLK